MTNNTPDYEDNLYFDSQNTKNEQQKDLCITDDTLTEQWKKGELTGEYWCEITESPYSERVFLPTCDKDIIVKVLDKVPSYNEWENICIENTDLRQTRDELDCAVTELREDIESIKQENHDLKEKNHWCNARAKNILAKNAQLKELLKECELWFTGIVGNMNDKNVGEHNRNLPIGNFEHIFKVFSQKINEVLK